MSRQGRPVDPACPVKLLFYLTGVKKSAWRALSSFMKGGVMQIIRKIVDRKNIKAIAVPEEFGEKVEVIILPVTSGAEGYSDWTDKEWQDFSLSGFMNTKDDKDVDWEEFFGVENG